MQPFYGLASNIKVLSGALAVLALALFIPFATNLVQQQVSTRSQANVETTADETSLSLQQHQFNCAVGDPANGVPAAANCNQLAVNKTFAVDVIVHSDIDPANLVNVQLSFPQNELTVEKIITQSSPSEQPDNTTAPKQAKELFVNLWVVREFENKSGTIKLIGAVPNPGFITSSNDEGATMARIYFKAKKAGTYNILFEGTPAIYRNADNENIVKQIRPLTITISQ